MKNRTKVILAVLGGAASLATIYGAVKTPSESIKPITITNEAHSTGTNSPAINQAEGSTINLNYSSPPEK
ncbi:hypothetical protein ACFQPC_07820 [Herminiimonas glaciei]|uniref:Uncharacterized protein n=1 Tax=Herminiimonas glaciei TaxID=523788 RepID=A0ABW2IAI4_9BURK